MRRHMARMKDDSGVAMIAVMGVLSVVTVIAIGAFFLGRQSLNESRITYEHTAAFQLAAAGMDAALADIQANGYQESHFPKIGNVAGMGSYEVSVTLEPDGQYKALSTGTATDGAVERIMTKFYYLNLWDISMGAGENASLGGGSGWNGNAAINGPLYVRCSPDDPYMHWTANAAFTGGPLFIKDGALDLQGSGDVGTDADPIRLYATDGYQGNTSNLHASSVSYSVPDIKLPWVDQEYMDAAMDLAMEQSVDNLMGNLEDPAIENTECVNVNPGSYPTVLAGRVRATTTPASGTEHYKYYGDGGHAALGAGTKSMQIGPKSFGAWEGFHGDAAGNTVAGGYPIGSGKHDDFAFDKSTGTLYVDGTVFVDGPVEFTSAVRDYVGNGAIVANGDVLVDGTLLAKHGLGGGRSEALGLISPGDIRINNAMQGAVFCNGTFSLYQTHTWYEGTVLAGCIYGDLPNITLTMNPILKNVLPEAMPGKGGAMLTQGAWVRP
jgi:hypothetical protein